MLPGNVLQYGTWLDGATRFRRTQRRMLRTHVTWQRVLYHVRITKPTKHGIQYDSMWYGYQSAAPSLCRSDKFAKLRHPLVLVSVPSAKLYVFSQSLFLSIYMYICLHMYVSVHLYIPYIYIYIHIYIYIVYVHIYMYIYIYIYIYIRI